LGNAGEGRDGHDGEKLLFFSRREELRFLRKFSSNVPDEGFRNVDPLIGTIISHGKATLNELKTIYDLEDAMILWESIVIPQYNEHVAAQEAAKKK
jgi:hypothetical protein